MIRLATWLDPKLSSPPPQPPLRPMLASTAVVPLASLFAARHVPTSGEQTWPRRRQSFGRRTGSPQAGRSRAAAAAADMGTLVWTRLADRRRNHLRHRDQRPLGAPRPRLRPAEEAEHPLSEECGGVRVVRWQRAVDEQVLVAGI